jgi:signal transduction histidine kinase
VAVALIAGAATAGSALWMTTREFTGYRTRQADRRVAELQQFLSAYYQTRQSWEGVATLLTTAHAPGNMQMHAAHMESGMHGATMPALMALMDLGARRLRIVDPRGEVLADTAGSVGGAVPAAELATGVPITVDGQSVGLLLLDRPSVPPLSALDQAYTRRLVTTAVLSGLGAAAVAGALGYVLALRFARPIRSLTGAASRMAQHDLSARVTVEGTDELAVLGREFNHMAEQLQRQEAVRRSMVADVAHELRTPVAILRGQFEAIQDGVAEPTPETLLPMHDEVVRLSRLLGDLQMLSLVDAGQLLLEQRAVAPAELAESAATAFGPAASGKDVAFDLVVATELPPVLADPDRTKQVLLNLLGNALRHTPEGGRISLTVKADGENVTFAVADTGEGISPDDLPHVFDRFYRGDKSRSRAGGGSGLGLAIARGIVEAHGGTIQVSSRVGEGTCFTFHLPADVRPKA